MFEYMITKYDQSQSNINKRNYANNCKKGDYIGVFIFKDIQPSFA